MQCHVHLGGFFRKSPNLSGRQRVEDLIWGPRIGDGIPGISKNYTIRSLESGKIGSLELKISNPYSSIPGT